jgi:hypothetical protein
MLSQIEVVVRVTVAPPAVAVPAAGLAVSQTGREVEFTVKYGEGVEVDLTEMVVVPADPEPFT